MGEAVWIANRNRRAFIVRLVEKGDLYGSDGCLVHEDAHPLVEFYEASDSGPSPVGYGLFLNRYHLSTLMRYPKNCALMIHGGIGEWLVDAEAMKLVVDWLSVRYPALVE
jgi:hypothetical protein